jgi:hypothetical protein
MSRHHRPFCRVAAILYVVRLLYRAQVRLVEQRRGRMISLKWNTPFIRPKVGRQWATPIGFVDSYSGGS